jgi:hypothetical protein
MLVHERNRRYRTDVEQDDANAGGLTHAGLPDPANGKYAGPRQIG